MIVVVTLLLSMRFGVFGKNFDYTTCVSKYNLDASNGDQFKEACPKYVHGAGSANEKGTSNNLKISYIEYPPYIYSDGNPGSPRGIWVDFIKDFVKRACMAGKRDISWNLRPYTSSSSMQDYCNGGSWRCSMSLPTFGYETSLTANGIEWASTFPVSSIALVKIPGEEWRIAVKNFLSSIVNTWPVFLLCFFAAFISGFFLWILDTWTNEEEFPRPYFRGLYQGVWWSIVSMTTVGYGDKSPVSFFGRVFAVIWIVIGITLIGVLTSLLSNGLTSGSAVPKLTFIGNKIGYLDVSRGALDTIIENGGIPVVTKDEIELDNFIARGLVDGIAVDTFQLQYYWKQRWSKIGVVFRVEGIFPYTKKHGISVYPFTDSSETYRNENPPSDKGQPWDDCMKEYMSANFEDYTEMFKKYKDTEKDEMDTNILQPPEPTDYSIFSPESEIFNSLVMFCTGIIIAILLFGLIFEYCRLYFFRPGVKIGLGLSYNAGYDGKGEKVLDEKELSKEEKNVQTLVEKAMKSSDERLQETQRIVHNEIMEMSRAIRREMVELKRKHQDYGL